MKNIFILAGFSLVQVMLTVGQELAKTVIPVITNGETQERPEFRDPESWIRHDLWVECEFDSDGDGKLDRVHVGVTRPQQTGAQGLKVPVIMICNPYFGGKPSNPRVSVRLASSKPAANLSVWLVSLPWTEKKGGKITDNIITRGWADPQNHRALMEGGEALEPGQFYDVAFDLQPDDQIIPAGQKIGLMILSSDRDFTLWPAPGTELTVDLDATTIVLPVVGGTEAVAKARARN